MYSRFRSKYSTVLVSPYINICRGRHLRSIIRIFSSSDSEKGPLVMLLSQSPHSKIFLEYYVSVYIRCRKNFIMTLDI